MSLTYLIVYRNEKDVPVSRIVNLLDISPESDEVDNNLIEYHFSQSNIFALFLIRPDGVREYICSQNSFDFHPEYDPIHNLFRRAAENRFLGTHLHLRLQLFHTFITHDKNPVHTEFLDV